jgi:NAD(P)H-hydrate repair Nnr-like enzyme with NAD(P)H-hydrate epimerase domain
LVCARELANHGHRVSVVLGREPDTVDGAAAHQHEIRASTNVEVEARLDDRQSDGGAFVDALVGDGLSGPPSGQTPEIL